MKFEGAGPWELPLTDFDVGRLTFGPDVDLVLDGPGEIVRVGLGVPFEFRDPSGSARGLDPETQGWPALAVLLSLIGDRVSAATASNESGLEIVFGSGRGVHVPPSPEFETWHVTGDDYKLIGAPGEVAIWDEDGVTRRAGA